MLLQAALYMAEELQLDSQSPSIGPKQVELEAVPSESASPPLTSQNLTHPIPHRQNPNSDQLAVGHHIIQIGSVHGGIVQIAAPEQQPRTFPRTTPVFLLPRPFAGLLGRQTEIATAIATLQTKLPVEFYSGSRFGKTVMLRHLAYDPQVTLPFADGTVYLAPSTSQTLIDVLQALFDSFYQSDIPFKPTETQLRQALQHQQALILLDDQHLQHREVEALINAVPGCTFLLASPERRLEEGRSLLLPGLPLPEALMLIERELGRTLTDSEQTSAQALWHLLAGNPRHLLYAVGQVRNQPIALAELVRQIRGASPLQTLIRNILTSLSERQRWVLAGLAALDGVGLMAKQAAALTDMPDAEVILETLHQSHLLQTEGSRYSLSQALVTSVEQTWDLTAWQERALHYFSAWAEQHQAESIQLLANMDAIAQVLQWAVSTEQWAATLQLVRVIEGTLALGKQWGLWAQVLQWGLAAARSLGDSMAEAWALHQLGTRALCLNDITTARELLTQALQMREALGDESGAAVTRHNLSLLPPVPLPFEPQRDRFWLFSLSLILGLLIAGLVGFIVSTLHKPSPSSPTQMGLSFRPIALDFASQTVGIASSERSVTLENQHTQPLQLTRSPEILGSHAADFAISTNECPTVISAQTSCLVKIRFQPSTLGQRRASLVVTDPGGERQVLLTGMGLQATADPQSNQAPVAQADTGTTDFEQAVRIDVLANDRDPDDDALIFSLATAPEHGSARVEEGAIVYQPQVGFSGTDQFTYKLQDGRGGAALATVTITVKAPETPNPNTSKPPVNQAPVANADTAKTESATPVTIAVLANDTDPDDDRLTAVIELAPQNGVAEVNEDGTVTYQPHAGFSGPDVFSYQASDGRKSAAATVTVTVATAPNRDPIAAADTATLAFFDSELGSVTIAVLANDRDPDDDPLQIESVTDGELGSVVVNDNQTITYSLSNQFGQQAAAVVAGVSQPKLQELAIASLPPLLFQRTVPRLTQVTEASDRFTYTITDGRGGTATASVTVTIDFSRQPEPETQPNPETNTASS